MRIVNINADESGEIAVTPATPETQLADLEALQRAALLIRSRANLAAGSPWKAAPVWSSDSTSTSAVYSHAHPTGTVASEVVASGRVRPGYGGIRNPHNAVHIASFADPAVALAVADLFDKTVAEYATEEDSPECSGCAYGGLCPGHPDTFHVACQESVSECKCIAPISTIARAYLSGGAS